MRFFANFNPVIRIFLWIMTALSLAGIVLAVLVFCGVPLEITYAQSTLIISVCPISAIIAIILATVHYKIDDTNLRLYVGFFDVFSGKVSINRILNIVVQNKKLYISYLSTGVDPVIARIAIPEKKYKNFKEALLSKNKNIVCYEEENETGDSQQ